MSDFEKDLTFQIIVISRFVIGSKKYFSYTKFKLICLKIWVFTVTEITIKPPVAEVVSEFS
jgi:hypothetical protein